jgi:hypothetical protein
MTDKEVAILDDCDSAAFYQYSLPLAGTDGHGKNIGKGLIITSRRIRSFLFPEVFRIRYRF